jgi:broad specificity phosphatase PhoE
MEATLLLARHGRTAWHDENRYAGRTDIPLDAAGRAQAQALAAWAAGAGLDAVVSSPLARAVETAGPAAAAAGLPLARDERLRELDFGSAEGLKLDELRQRDPEAVRRFEADPVGYPLPGGENPLAAAARARECLNALAAAHPGSRVLVVAHNTLIRLALCLVIGIRPADYRRRLAGLDPVALTELRAGAAGVRLQRYNAPLAVQAPADTELAGDAIAGHRVETALEDRRTHARTRTR